MTESNPSGLGRPVVVVAIIGAKQSGKSTVANELVTDFGFTRFRFADPLKRMLAAIGLTSEDLDGCKKEVPNKFLCGHTPRYAMQTLGTEWRDYLNPNLWSVILVQDVQRFARESSVPGRAFVVIDDMRFPHELDWLRKSFGESNVHVWRVVNPRLPYPKLRMKLARRFWGRALLWFFRASIHPSEAWWDALPADRTICNDSDLESLYNQVRGIVFFDFPDLKSGEALRLRLPPPPSK
jgi:hypothetical protein